MGYVQSALEGGVDDCYLEWGGRQVCDGFTEELTYKLNKIRIQHALKVEKGIPSRRHSLSRGQGPLRKMFGRNMKEKLNLRSTWNWPSTSGLCHRKGVLPSLYVSDYPSLFLHTHTHAHIHAQSRKSSLNSWRRKLSFLGGACQADGGLEKLGGVYIRLYWGTRHLLQPPVSLKIILLLPAHPQKLQVCPALSLF